MPTGLQVLCSGCLLCFTLITKHSRLHTCLQSCTANTHAVEMQRVPWSAARSLICSAFPDLKYWMIQGLNPLSSPETALISLALTQSALLLFFPARHSLAPFPFSVALFVGHWYNMGYFWNWGSPLRVVFLPYRRGHTDPFLLCDRRLFQSRSHDMTIGTHAHPCWHPPPPPPFCSLCSYSQTGAKLHALECV